jgi:hypothetical protein
MRIQVLTKYSQVNDEGQHDRVVIWINLYVKERNIICFLADLVCSSYWLKCEVMEDELSLGHAAGFVAVLKCEPALFPFSFVMWELCASWLAQADVRCRRGATNVLTSKRTYMRRSVPWYDSFYYPSNKPCTWLHPLLIFVWFVPMTT